MGLAKDERAAILRVEGALGKADPDEPIFVLRGQDKLAPALVRAWATLADELGCPPEKVLEANYLADQMVRWHKRKFPD